MRKEIRKAVNSGKRTSRLRVARGLRIPLELCRLHFPANYSALSRRSRQSRFKRELQGVNRVGVGTLVYSAINRGVFRKAE